jgi:hypothetical protein
VIITDRPLGEQLCWSEPWMRFSARTVAVRHGRRMLWCSADERCRGFRPWYASGPPPTSTAHASGSAPRPGRYGRLKTTIRSR